MNQNNACLDSPAEIVKKEILEVETQVADLERQYSSTPALLQVLGRWLAFGPSEKLSWVRFKLKLKRQDLRPDSNGHQSDPANLSNSDKTQVAINLIQQLKDLGYEVEIKPKVG
jgi:hypothetical protein